MTSNGFKTVVDIVPHGSFNVTQEVGRRVTKNQNDDCSFSSISATHTFNTVELLDLVILQKPCRITRELGLNTVLTLAKGGFGNLSSAKVQDSIGKVSSRVFAGKCRDIQEVANIAAFIAKDYVPYTAVRTPE
uniref:Protein kinase domain-containing protein n=1 Tax=Strongyloides papillosus TaxID=174720 RepID=A0A0N5C8E6_STREA